MFRPVLYLLKELMTEDEKREFNDKFGERLKLIQKDNQKEKVGYDESTKEFKTRIAEMKKNIDEKVSEFQISDNEILNKISKLNEQLDQAIAEDKEYFKRLGDTKKELDQIESLESLYKYFGIIQNVEDISTTILRITDIIEIKNIDPDDYIPMVMNHFNFLIAKELEGQPMGKFSISFRVIQKILNDAKEE